MNTDKNIESNNVPKTSCRNLDSLNADIRE